MSEKLMEHKIFLQERDRIDFLIEQGYKIINITETLNGDFVQFKKDGEEIETLQIINPEARKYFTVLLIKQQKEGA